MAEAVAFAVGQRAHDQAREHVEQRGLAAALLRRGDREPRRNPEAVEQVGVQHPQRGGIRRMIGHDDMPANVRRERAQQLGAVDRLGPRLRFGQTQCTTLLAAVIELVAFGRDEAIERRRANLETLGSVLALALVFQPAELGQPADFAVSIRGQLDPVPMAV